MGAKLAIFRDLLERVERLGSSLRCGGVEEMQARVRLQDLDLLLILGCRCLLALEDICRWLMISARSGMTLYNEVINTLRICDR